MRKSGVSLPEGCGGVHPGALPVAGGGAGVEVGVPARHQTAPRPTRDVEGEVTLNVGESVGPVVLQLHRLSDLNITITMEGRMAFVQLVMVESSVT